MKRIINIFILLMVFGSCSDSKKPSELLSKDKLAIVLTDVHIAESSLQMFSATQRDSIGRLYYGHIFRIHEIEEADYYNTIEYYTSRPKELTQIYDRTHQILLSKHGKVDITAPK